MSDISSAIKQHILTEFMSGTGNLDEETRLVDDEIIDSLGIFLLIGFIKERFGIEIEPEEVTMENFSSIQAITNLIERSQVSS